MFLTALTGAQGQALQFTHDGLHRMVAVTDAVGQVKGPVTTYTCSFHLRRLRTRVRAL